MLYTTQSFLQIDFFLSLTRQLKKEKKKQKQTKNPKHWNHFLSHCFICGCGCCCCCWRFYSFSPSMQSQQYIHIPYAYAYMIRFCLYFMWTKHENGVWWSRTMFLYTILFDITRRYICIYTNICEMYFSI